LREKESLLLQVAGGGHGKDGAQVTGIFAKFAGSQGEAPFVRHSFHAMVLGEMPLSVKWLTENWLTPQGCGAVRVG
jgi:hypothetical protein